VRVTAGGVELGGAAQIPFTPGAGGATMLDDDGLDLADLQAPTYS
jgi:hypothetical protein